MWRSSLECSCEWRNYCTSGNPSVGNALTTGVEAFSGASGPKTLFLVNELLSRHFLYILYLILFYFNVILRKYDLHVDII